MCTSIYSKKGTDIERLQPPSTTTGQPPNSSDADPASTTADSGNALLSYEVWPPEKFLAHKVDMSDLLLGDGYLEKGEWTSLIGVGGVGKTRLALLLCIAQITGKSWCGIETHGEPQKCLFLSSENGLRRWHDDFKKIFRELSQRDADLVMENLRVLALTPTEPGDLNLGNDQNALRIRATLAQEKPGIIVLDPFADMVAGDEKKTADLVQTLQILRTIHRQTAPRAAVLVVHHARTGKDTLLQLGDNFSAGNFARGSKVLYSSVRCEIQVGPASSEDSARLVLACGKCNNAEKFATRGLIFDHDNMSCKVDPDFDLDAFRANASGQRGMLSATIKDVVQAVAALCRRPEGTASTKEIIEAVTHTTGASVRTIKTRMSKAVQLTYLNNVSHGHYTLGPKSLA